MSLTEQSHTSRITSIPGLSQEAAGADAILRSEAESSCYLEKKKHYLITQNTIHAVCIVISLYNGPSPLWMSSSSSLRELLIMKHHQTCGDGTNHFTPDWPHIPVWDPCSPLLLLYTNSHIALGENAYPWNYLQNTQ